MDSWRKVWREGIVPLLTTEGLQALEKALTSDDTCLLQRATTKPPPLQCVQDWQGEGLETVAEVEEYFARLCFEVDQRLGEPAACRRFLNWFDETPRPQVIRELLPEVKQSLRDRDSVPLAPSVRPPKQKKGKRDTR